MLYGIMGVALLVSLVALACAIYKYQAMKAERDSVRGTLEDLMERIRQASEKKDVFTPTPTQLEILKIAVEDPAFCIFLNDSLSGGIGKLMKEAPDKVIAHLHIHHISVDEKELGKIYQWLEALHIWNSFGRVTMDPDGYDAAYGETVPRNSWLVSS
ncbi:hypothetical protein CL614_00740 [archaeon]|nr:hypothetical protein [archaeon]